MGWDWTNRERGETIFEFFKDRFYTDNEKYGYNVLACSVVKRREAYLACEKIDKVNNTRIVFGIVCLLGYAPKSYYNFGYKDMDETMLPYYFNCPEKILNMLTPTTNEQSMKWRDECRNVQKMRKELRKLEVDTVIELDPPIQFMDGFTCKNLKVKTKRPLRFLPVNADSNGNRYTYKCSRATLIDHKAKVVGRYV